MTAADAKKVKTKKTRAKPAKQTGVRDKKKAHHRDLLIDATIKSIAEHGYAGTTVSTIQAISGLSRGMINLHFSSKEVLFQAALTRLANNYETFWRAALIKGGSKPASQLMSVLKNDLSNQVLKSDMLSVWYAFRAEANSHPEYLELCGTRDKQYTAMLNNLCLNLAESQGENLEYARDSASGIYAMVEGFWVEAFLHPKTFNKSRATRVLHAFIKSRFPKSFK
ncbi:TetR family transcriptional regulator C-terminal domain-containing protein [Curvivirga sp.]|uniref:TetR family transcriptional regulator C-terminal domain-containing protein n=1 Tax=Curvivirga sp. TaxID=2856848 RepID=UPI003B5BC481